VGSETVTFLLEVSGLELDTATGAETEHGHPGGDEAGLAVLSVLGDRICGAKGGVEGTREGLLADAVRLLVVKLVSARLGLRARRKRGRVVGLLVVTVGADNDNIESALVLALV
jgi:hypothetical protein